MLDSEEPVYPTLTALTEGFRVQVVADAGGSMSKLADDVALRRMENAGAGITSTNMILTELPETGPRPPARASSRLWERSYRSDQAR